MKMYAPFFQYPALVEHEDIDTWKVIDPNSSIKTGDVLLFSASGILSTVIKTFSGSKWSHVGMACWCELKMKDGSVKTDLCCYEMGSQPYTDLLTRKIVEKGVRLVRLADIAVMYDLIAVRRINRDRKIKGTLDKKEKKSMSRAFEPLESYIMKRNRDKTTDILIQKLEDDDGGDEEFIKRFSKFMDKWKGTPYCKSIFTLFRSFTFRAGIPKGEAVCSQFVALILHDLKVHHLKYDPSQLSPAHFANGSKAFPEDMFLGPEQTVYKDFDWLNRRIGLVTVLVIILIIVLLVLIYNSYKKKK